MTLLIAKDGCLHADKRILRGVGNWHVLTALNSGDKIVKLPFGAYGISGTDPENDKEAKMMHEDIFCAFAAIEYADYLERNFDKLMSVSGTKLADLRRLVHVSFFEMVRQIAANSLGTIAKKNHIYILGVTRYHNVYANPDSFGWHPSHAPIAVGSTEKIARYFLADNHPIEYIFEVASTYGAFTSKEFDTFDCNALPDLAFDITCWRAISRIWWSFSNTFSPVAANYYKGNMATTAGSWNAEEKDTFTLQWFTVFRIINRHIKPTHPKAKKPMLVQREKPIRWYGKDGKLDEKGLIHRHLFPGLWSYVLDRVYTKDDWAADKEKFAKLDAEEAAKLKETETKKS